MTVLVSYVGAYVQNASKVKEQREINIRPKPEQQEFCAKQK